MFPRHDVRKFASERTALAPDDRIIAADRNLAYDSSLRPYFSEPLRNTQKEEPPSHSPPRSPRRRAAFTLTCGSCHVDSTRELVDGEDQAARTVLLREESESDVGANRRGSLQDGSESSVSAGGQDGALQDGSESSAEAGGQDGGDGEFIRNSFKTCVTGEQKGDHLNLTCVKETTSDLVEVKCRGFCSGCLRPFTKGDQFHEEVASDEENSVVTWRWSVEDLGEKIWFRVEGNTKHVKYAFFFSYVLIFVWINYFVFR